MKKEKTVESCGFHCLTVGVEEAGTDGNGLHLIASAYCSNDFCTSRFHTREYIVNPQDENAQERAKSDLVYEIVSNCPLTIA